MKYDAIIVGGGIGSRAELGYNKVLFRLKNGRTVLEESAHLFIEDEDCQKVIIVVNDEFFINNPKVIVTKGGKERKDSVKNGLQLVESPYVLVHDGSRPFLNKNDLEKLKKNLETENAAILVKKCVETIKYSEDDYVNKTIDRNHIYLALTPQGARTELLKEAYSHDIEATDEAQLLENCNIKVKLVIGSSTNIKLTNKEDFEGL